ncbi:MAG: T9SS type A sorting domain-containing protein [Ignavibacteria bacterium]|nr:T9SS type A sorting domain-containing protein [Ignavibacteria bacterium]
MKHTPHTRAVRFLSGLLYFFSIFIFINAINFQHNPPSGWYRQSLPQNLPPINVLTFKDSLTGYAVTMLNSDNKSYVIKTTDGGDNWSFVLTDSSGRMFTDVEFLNSSTGFVCTNYETGGGKLLRTTNGGIEWSAQNNPNSFFAYDDLYVLSESELWAVWDAPFDGGVFRTTNGGTTWQRKYYSLSFPADRIYMVNSRIGFISDGYIPNSYLRKTTDFGETWTEVLNGDGWYNIHFKDSLEGWRSKRSVFQKTTDCGLTWTTLLEVSAGNPDVAVSSFSIIGEDTIWGVDRDANMLYPNFQFRGVITKTTNAGLNWGYQIPDTSFRMPFFVFCEFLDPKIGWAYSSVHTVSGGDSVTFPLTSVGSQSTSLPPSYRLFQNYPNPFNPSTTIEYELDISSNVLLKISDTQGKEVRSLVNSRQQSGKHKVEFDAEGLPSGIYFYSLYLEKSFVQTRKMILIR